ncbi:MAG: hypothetical protein CMK07_03720 [Ponticaulis sp.]|nr:hypothetical protein [Ponticaulis sp.]
MILPSHPLAARGVSWLTETCLPYWMHDGVDKQRGGAIEAVALDGTPLTEMNRRVRIQARQTYVFAHASLLGLAGADEALAYPLDWLATKAPRGDGGFGHLLSPDGELIDRHADLYDHAFVLFALAWAFKVTGDTKLKALADAGLEFVNTKLRHPVAGFLEQEQSLGSPRRANPHMHLFEAAMAWMKLHQHERFAALASELSDLFHDSLWQNGLLREHFEDDLSLIKTDPSDVLLCVEPGHLYEWATLLNQYEALTGQASSAPALLSAFSDEYGYSSDTGLLLDFVYTNGEPHPETSSRLWPQAEAIRYLLECESDTRCHEAYELIDRTLTQYMTIEGKLRPYWTDHPVSDSTPPTGKSPASSLYHMFGCLQPLLNAR